MKKRDLILKAIGNPVRIKILEHLIAGPSCVTLTNKQIQVSQPNLSQHLKVLKETGIIESKKMQTKRCYSLKNPKLIKKILKAINDLTDNVSSKRVSNTDSGRMMQDTR